MFSSELRRTHHPSGSRQCWHICLVRKRHVPEGVRSPFIGPNTARSAISETMTMLDSADPNSDSQSHTGTTYRHSSSRSNGNSGRCSRLHAGITGRHHPTQPDMCSPTHCRQQRRIAFDACHRTHTSFGGGMRTLERPSPVGAHRVRMRVRVECAELRFRATRSDRPGTSGATSDSLCSVLPAGNLAGYGTGAEGRQSEAATCPACGSGRSGGPPRRWQRGRQGR